MATKMMPRFRHSTYRRFEKQVLLASLFFVFAACASGSEPLPHEKTEAEIMAETHVIVDATSVKGMRNKFLLARKGNDACAVRFTNFRRDYDEKPATRFHSGNENRYADYEWIYQGDGSGDFTKENVKSGKGKVHFGPWVGIGQNITLWRSSDKWWVECGPLTIHWVYPAGLAFLNYAKGGARDDYELRLAGTNWSMAKDIDINNPKLRWAKLLNQTILPIEIPISELP